MTDLMKFKQLFDSIGIKYDEERGMTKLPTTLLFIDNENLSGNRLVSNECVAVKFDADGNFKCFIGTGE